MTIYCITFNGLHIICDQEEIITSHKDNKNISSLKFGTEEDAKQKLVELQTKFYDMELSKIHVVKKLDDGYNTIWVPFNVNSDIVENTASYIIQTNIDNTSVHTKGETLYDDIELIKKNMLRAYNLDNYIILDDFPVRKSPNNILINQPKSEGTNTI